MTSATSRTRPIDHSDPDRLEVSASASAPASHWPLERVLVALAGTLLVVGALLAAVVSPWFLLLTAFVGVNQLVYVAVHNCPASLLLGRYAEPQCTW